MVLDQPSAVPGGQAVAEGRDCEPGGEVVVQIGGEVVGRTVADEQGDFRAELSLPTLAIGRHEVVARCGAVTLRSPLDIVLVTASGGIGSSATVGIVMSFFILFALIVFRSPAMMERRRRRHATDLP